MNIVILDLEWDSGYCLKHRRFVNHIIQIGAVKVDANLNIIDKFDVIVYSKIHKKLTKRFVSLTGITTEQMLSGVPLDKAFEMYNKWSADSDITMTFSTTDLYTIIDNCRYLLPEGAMLNVGNYVDLQSFVQNEMCKKGFTITSQISLSNAAEQLGISVDGLELHKAKDDCILSLALLREFYSEELLKPYIKDTTNPEFFKRLTFKTHPISNIRNDEIKPEFLQFNCDRCGAFAKCVTGWKYKNGWFSANFRCGECKRAFIGRVSVKKTYDDVVVKKRILELKPVEKKDADKLQAVPKKV